jgi:hypothetical protein
MQLIIFQRSSNAPKIKQIVFSLVQAMILSHTSDILGYMDLMNGCCFDVLMGSTFIQDTFCYELQHHPLVEIHRGYIKHSPEVSKHHPCDPPILLLNRFEVTG